MWNMISHSHCFAHSIWVHDEPAGKVWIAEVAAVGLIHCNVWPAATPSDGKCAMVPRLRWRGLLWRVEVEVEMEVTSLPLSRLPPTIIHASILSFSFFYSHPPVLYLKVHSCVCPRTHFFFVGFFHSPRIADNMNSSQ